MGDLSTSLAKWRSTASGNRSLHHGPILCLICYRKCYVYDVIHSVGQPKREKLGNFFDWFDGMNCGCGETMELSGVDELDATTCFARFCL